MGKIRLFFTALRNLFIGFNLFSLILIFSPKKMVYVLTTILFYFKTLSGKGRFEQKNPDEVITSNKKYNIRIDTDCYFWGSDPSYVKDIITLCLMVKIINAKSIFEIGTLDGYSALHFAMNSSIETKIYTLDLPPDFSEDLKLNVTSVDALLQKKHSSIKKYRFNDTEYNDKINCLFSDSANFDYSIFFKQIDLFFIDGAHSYEYVKSDTFNAMKCVREGGIIVWHDYGRMGVNGVTKWLCELSNSGKKIYSVPGSSLAYHIVGLK